MSEKGFVRRVDGAMAENSTTKECCICGDVGFSSALLLCHFCGYRFQHTYCSGSYPNIDMEKWRCEWCIHEESKKQQRSSSNSNNAFEFLLEIAKSLPDGEDNLRPPPNNNNGNEEIKKLQRRKRDDDKQHQRPKPKRQKSFDRWGRPPNCNSSSAPRVIGRRYKLLADVLC